MTVKVSKAALNLREELADLRKPSSIAGEALLRADSVQEQRDLIGAGRRNLLINGDMRVVQRGTTFTRSGSGWGYFGSMDRWAVYYGNTVFNQTTGIIDGQYKHYARITNNGTAPDNYFIYQKIENGSRILSGKEITISFMAKSANSTPLRVRGRFFDHALESGSTDSGLKMFSLTPEWQKYSYTYTPVDTSTNLTRDFTIIIDTNGVNGLSDGYDITNVQLELGSVATEFEHRSYGEELALCQRYFYQMSSSGSGYIASIVNRGIRYMTDKIPSMRGTPALSYDNAQVSVDGGNYTNVTPSIVSYTDGGNVLIALGSGSNDEDVLFYGNLKYDAEL